MTVQRNLTGFRFVETQVDDTLQAISARELGDASKWALLVDINGLSYPYLTDDPAVARSVAGDTVKLYGQSIIVPAATAQISAEVDPDRVFGVDLQLESGSLMVVNGDFALVSGRANLRQALSNRVSTALGELLFHLGYGCGVHRLKGAGNGPTQTLLGASYVKSAMQADDRVDSVPACVATSIGDAISVEAAVQPVAGTSLEIGVTV